MSESQYTDGSPERGVPLKHLDRIADFFGIATYQLLQPGISPLTERRSGRERRTGHDRRVSMAGQKRVHTPDLETVTAYERTLLTTIRRLDSGDRKHLEFLLDRLQSAAPKTATPADPGLTSQTPAALVQRTGTRRKH